MENPRKFAFVHGGGQGGWVWEKTIAAIHQKSPGTLALALDVPGCGKKRARNTANLDNPAVAHDLIQDIEHAALSDVVLVGHSQAGQILPFMAMEQPGLFRHLIYISSSLPLPGQTVMAMIGTGRQGCNDTEIGYPFDADSIDIAEFFPTIFCNDMAPEQKTPFLAKLGQDQWPAKTYEYAAWPAQPSALPATYVVCERDNILPTAWQERFAQRLGATKTIRIDAGHQVMISQAEALAEILLQSATG